jgi:hypothetical protein
MNPALVAEMLQESTMTPRRLPKPPWQLVVVSILGGYWAIDFLVPALAHGIHAPLAWLPLLGFLAPVLCNSPRRIWRRMTFWLCAFEVCISPLLWIGSISSFMDPQGFKLRFFGVAFMTIWSVPGQFVYCAIRGLVFAAAAILTLSAPPLETASKVKI